MKKNYILTTLFLFSMNFSFGQALISKPLIDSGAYRTWTTLSSPVISNDGRYAIYAIENQPIGSITQVVKSIDNKWEKRLVDFSRAQFIENSKIAVVSSSERLIILTLGTDEEVEINGLKSYKLSKNSNEQWLAYQSLKSPDELSVVNFRSKRVLKYEQIKDYRFCPSGGQLLLQEMKGENICLKLINLKTGIAQSIWEGKYLKNLILNEDATQIAFVSNISSDGKSPVIWLYREGLGNAKELINEDTIRSEKLQFVDLIRFSNDDSRMFLHLQRQYNSKHNENEVLLNIWSYKDSLLQSEQLNKSNRKSDLYAMDIATTRMIKIEDENDRVILSFYSNESDIWLSGSSRTLVPGELENIKHFIVSSKTGKRIVLPNYSLISPDGKYAIYYDSKLNNYFSYEISSGLTKNISKNISNTWSKSDDDDDDSFIPVLRGVGGWIPSEESVLMYDQYDVFKFDLNGVRKPINITNGYGRRNRIVFNLIPNKNGYWTGGEKSKIWLVGFNKLDKENGFFVKKVSQSGDPDLLSIGAYLYWNPTAMIGIKQGMMPLKAKDRQIYIVNRMKASESPNYFVTSDFTTFQPISDIYPERNYNWLNTELHVWKTTHGKELRGVLFKPENFDSTKKYPLIFYYYRKLSDGLNVFIKPDYSDGRLNIPWYVSNGYLVFTPDIHYSLGNTGDNALDAVTTAADYLSKLAYVNNSKMGIQGVSFGGLQTNYIVTHSNVFAAACSSSGHYDLVSGYGGLFMGGQSKQGMFEKGSYQIGAKIWDNPKAYLKNSPILYADRVVTPFLMMHTTEDSTIPLAEAIEFFTALRRLGKRGWMLQYDKWDHGLLGKEAEDFDLRMQQFFDYYLRGAPPPKWMTQGRPASLRGIDDRLELDLSGTVP